MTEERKAILLSTGSEILVYKSKLRGTWVNSNNCTTEYKPTELKFK